MPPDYFPKARKCPLIQVKPYSIAEKEKEDADIHKIVKLYEFLKDSSRY